MTKAGSAEVTNDGGYPNPPITEAVIEIRFEQTSTEDELRKFSAKLAPDYPSESINHQQGFHFDLLKAVMEVKDEGAVVRRANADENEIVLLGPKNLIVSQLAVYPGWQRFFGRFSAVWGAWRKFAGFRKIQRIGVRYINRLDLPVSDARVDHEEYLNAYVAMPPAIDPISAYSFQVQAPLPDLQSLVTINSASVPSPLPDAIAFVLDIDVGRMVDVPQKDKDLFDFLQQVRIKKNELFEACVKDAARERFTDANPLR